MSAPSSLPPNRRGWLQESTLAAAALTGLPRYGAANRLTDDRYFDNLSGQQAYKCFVCRLK